MKIILAKNSGFCFGVRSAVELAEKNAGPKTYTYGNIIHNERVLTALAEKGIKSTEDLSVLEPSSTVIIRSHGAKKSVYDYLRERGHTIVDATCPFVKKIHDIVKEHYEKGFQIVIIGASDHPEVVGINGWCNDSAIIIDEKSDVESLADYEKLCFVTQTTFSTEKYSQILKKIQTYCLKTVEIFDTICYTTVGRQNEAKKLASVCDKVLVLGSAGSSNTRKLFDIASSPTCRSYAVTDLTDLIKINFSAADTVGIIAGASTPDELIMEVKEYMEEKNFAEVQNEEFLEAIDKSFVNYKEGKRIEGSVITADEKGITLKIGGKNDGFIPANEVNLDGSYDPAAYAEGDKLEVRIGKKDQETGLILLSKKAIDEIKEADKVVDTIRNGENFEIKIDKEVKMGLTAKLGTYSIFIPASQVEERFVRDLKKYVGKKLVVTALEIDDNKHKIVASHRKVAETERKAKEDIFWANVVPNMIVSGVVKRTTAFGAFVSVDGFDCLAHIVDLSWTHIKNVEEVLTVGESYEFVVLSADREKNRVSLGYKQLQPHPFVACMEKHPVGSTLKGKVVSVVPFGVFVEVEPHIEGLVHVSEVAHSFVKDIKEAINVGDEVEVKVLNYDEEKRNINLSIKACLPEEVKEEKKEEVKETEEKKARKPRKVKESAEPQEEKEWSEDVSNNPFADLLKNLDVQD